MDYLTSPGHKKLMEQCAREAHVLGLENVSVHWSDNYVDKEHSLDIDAKTGTISVIFSNEAVQEYDRGIGISSANTKILEALRKIQGGGPNEDEA